MRSHFAMLGCLMLQLVASPAEENLPEAVESVPSVRLRPQEIPRTFAPESQFTAYGKNGDLRVELFRLAEKTRKEMYAALAQKTKTGKINVDKGWLPIVLQLRDQVALGPEAVQGAIRVMPDDTISLDLQIATGTELNRGQFRNEIVRWLIVDLMMRRVRAEHLATAGQLSFPDWLHQGLLELMSYQEKGRPSEVFASVFRLGKTLTIEEILNADITGMDSVSMAIYRVSSCALVLMMLDQPNGADHLLTCLADLPANQGPITKHLEHYFPILRGSANQLEKWWSLFLATFAEPTRTELLTMQETEKALAEALVFTFQPADSKTAEKSAKKSLNPFKRKLDTTSEAPAKDGPAAASLTIPVAEFPRVLTEAKVHEISERTLLALTKLSLRAHPFYRSLILDYQKQIAKIGQHKGSGVAESLENLSTRRQKMFADAKASEDYLDWYQATQRESLSGSFQSYLEAADLLERPPSQHQDAISRYLNALEKEYK